MKKLFTILLVFVICISCAACSINNTDNSALHTSTPSSCIHVYSSATCTSPQKCTKCSTTKGSALGHNYKAATCTAPKTCTRCNITTGSSLGHDFTPANCTKPETCARCNKTIGEKLGHSYIKERNGDYWTYRCYCGSSYNSTIKINYFNEIVDFVVLCGQYDNKRYTLFTGSDVSSGYTYTRSVVYDSLTHELCFTLTFGNDIKLNIYMTTVSRQYQYYFEDNSSNYYMKGILDTDGCTLYFSYLYSENIIKTNVPSYLESDFAKLLQSQVVLFIKCFNVDFIYTQITAQDFCFPNV